MKQIKIDIYSRTNTGLIMCNLTNLVNNISNNFKKEQMLDTIIPFVEKYDSDDWKKYIKFSNHKYIRNLVFRNDMFEIYIICWNNNQKSPIHDHSENGCVMKILQGRLTQILYTHDFTSCKSTNFKKDDISYIHNNIGLHKILNYNEQTCSLHIYSPPLHKTNIY